MASQHHHATPSEPDSYRLLGITPGATVEQINSAYRRAVRRLHPDTAPIPDAASAEQDAPGHAPATLNELQAARARLLNAHTRPAPREHARPDPPVVRRRTTPPVRRRGEPDLIVGPVRYHGPSGRW